MSASVIIPCYNCEKTIGATLDALNAQRVKPAEIIIIDDGSTDKTASIIRQKQTQNKKIKYYWQKNSGPAKARNAGAKKAKQEIIIFTDSDCVPEEDWLAEMTAPFKNNKVSGVQGAYKTKQKELIARFGQIEIEERYERMKNAKIIDWIGSYSAAFRRKEFLLLKGYDESFPIASGEDPEFSFRLAKNGGKLEFNPLAIVYHTHPNTLHKYLRTKFFRAYYRPKMYSKHKEKALNDSYTPQLLKLQIPLTGIVWISLITIPLIGFVPAGFALIIFLASTIPFVSFALKRNWSIALLSPIIILLRSTIFGTGLLAGIVKGGKK